MKRDEFMDKARQELDLIMTSLGKAIMNIIEQAWAEGKRNAELDAIKDIVKQALDGARPSYPVTPSYPDPVSPWINPIITCDTAGAKPPEAHFADEEDKEKEPIEPKWASGIKGGADALCGSCMAWLSDHSWGYCPRCGRKVKWDEIDR